MSKLRYYIRLIRRHRRYDGWRQALRFAWSHKAFWNGCDDSDAPYVHIGRNLDA